MPVPETAMREDYRMVPGQDNIRFAGQFFAAQRKAETLCVQDAAHQFFKTGVV